MAWVTNTRYARPMSTHIYFDLDGTLTDPYEGITKSIVYALERFDVAVPPKNQLTSYIDPSLRDTFAELVGRDSAERALVLYRERYADIGWRENTPYYGIHDVLETLSAAGHKLFVATAKPTVFATKIIEHFRMDRYFDNILGCELDGTRGDKTDLLTWALPQFSPGQRSIMVGDRSHDMVAARNCGMEALGVTYGYGSAEELQSSGATRIVHRPPDLAGVLL